ncbi:hypothetical protein Ocin01_12768 [Orchesella cincta]|uniref:Uncharacterized protein n=1 Tax=Orchesella cincta TaxID=48709 RepID=A0A1D2MM80_ORCCI|nr:hypothetical protein Ocin01_12768 [Orchesella cincta]
MHLVQLPFYRKGLPESASFTTIVIATCLLYLSGMVEGEPSDWRTAVPKNKFQQAPYYHHQHHHAHATDPLPSARSEFSHHHNHHHSPSPAFTSRVSDPRMGYFYADTTSASSLIPKPRSLPTSTSSKKAKRDSNSNQNAAVTKMSHVESATSRTFFITPFLATMAPVFLAQMFGMSMIPAAGLILLPVLLLPLALTMAVFLV